MGVRWLTTYVKEVERVISSSEELKVNQNEGSTTEHTEQDKPTFVVDCWAFIFKVWLDLFGDSIRGLDYVRYKDAVRIIIESWLSTGSKVTFVMDGPFLPSKLPAIIKRRATYAACNNGFMHSSPQSRTSKALQLNSNIIPPFLFSSTVDAINSLQSKGVRLLFSPTEADSLVAELATESGSAYAVSQDSDFFILCSRGKGCQGYVPLDSIEYISKILGEENGKGSRDDKSSFDDNDGFQQVGRKKKGGSGIHSMKSFAESLPIDFVAKQATSFPPSLIKDSKGELLSVKFRAFSPHKLASHLELPPTLLPLFAAIVGNDYTSSIQRDLFLRHVEGIKRIPIVAAAIRTEWLRMQNEAKSSSNRKGQSRLAMTSNHDFDDGRSDVGSSATATPTRNTPGATRPASTIVPTDPVRSLVDAVVNKLLSQSETNFKYPRTVASGERELIVDSIIDSAATYTLLTHSDAPHLTSPSAAFFGEAMSLLANRREYDRIAAPEAVKRYRQAFYAGHFREYLIETMTQRVFITRQLPEDPEQPSIHSFSGRHLRLWIYAVLFEVWGMGWARKEWEEPTTADEDERSENGSTEPPIFQPDRTYKEGEKPDDVISVNTESSSENVDETELEDLFSRPGSVMEEREADKPAPGVVEYVRAGSLFVKVLVRIPTLSEMLRSRGEILPTILADVLARHQASQSDSQIERQNQTPESDPIPEPIVLMPINVRFDLFLHAHHSHTPAISALPKRYWLVASVMRFMIISESERLQESNKVRSNWSLAEVKVAVNSMLIKQLLSEKSNLLAAEERVKSVFPTTRAIHLASYIQLISELSNALGQALLLTQEADWIEPHTCFSGPAFHLGMARIHDGIGGEEEMNSDVAMVCQAIVEGLHDRLGIDASDIKKERKAKKAAIKAARSSESVVKKASATSKAARNAFDALIDNQD